MPQMCRKNSFSPIQHHTYTANRFFGPFYVGIRNEIVPFRATILFFWLAMSRLVFHLFPAWMPIIDDTRRVQWPRDLTGHALPKKPRKSHDLQQEHRGFFSEKNYAQYCSSVTAREKLALWRIPSGKRILCESGVWLPDFRKRLVGKMDRAQLRSWHLNMHSWTKRGTLHCFEQKERKSTLWWTRK